MRPVLVSLVLVSWVAVAAAEPDRRAARDAMIGCWNADRGATLVLTRKGKRDVRAIATFSHTPRGGPKRFVEDAVWVPATGEYEVRCRPRSQHGSFCRIRPEAGGLRIRVFAKGHATGARGRLVEDFVAARCTKR